MKKYLVTYETKHKRQILNTIISQWKKTHEEIVEADSFYDAKRLVKSKNEDAINLQAREVRE